MTLRGLHRAPRLLLDAVTEWPVASQQHARRNALIASTELTQRRKEIDEVEEFLAARRTPRRTAADRTA
jgi:hypothetical protein